jgi:hypothetical protein
MNTAYVRRDETTLLDCNSKVLLANSADDAVDGNRVRAPAVERRRPRAVISYSPRDAHVHELLGVVSGEAVAGEDGGGGVDEVGEGLGWIVGREGQERPARVVVGEEVGLGPNSHVELGSPPGGCDFFDRLGELGQDGMALGVDDWDGAGETEVELVAGDGGEIWGYIERRRWRCGRGDEDAAGKLAVHMRKLASSGGASGSWSRGDRGFRMRLVGVRICV